MKLNGAFLETLSTKESILDKVRVKYVFDPLTFSEFWN